MPRHLFCDLSYSQVPIRLLAAIVLSPLLNLPAATHGQVSTLVRDIHPGTGPVISEQEAGAALGSVALFPGVSAANDYELWITDGTQVGTELLIDIFPGPDSGLRDTSLDSARLGGELFFPANDGVHGLELWKTDGTAAGTQLVKDVFAGPNGSFPFSLYSDGTLVYFGVNDDGTGSAVWTTDGTAAGTTKLASVTGSDFVSNGSLVFFRGVSPGEGSELMATDGTPAGTYQVADIQAGTGSSLPLGLVALGSTVLFAADDGSNGRELWRSDGTALGTFMVADINSAGSSLPASLGAVGGDLLFSAVDATNGRQLWKTNGTAATQIMVVSGSVGDSGAVLDGKVYFAAEDGSDGQELWRSDGQLSGTGQVADINPGPSGSSPDHFFAIDDRVLFDADDGVHGLEPWATNGATTQLVVDIDGTSDDSVEDFADSTVLSGDRLLFPAGVSSDTELWVTDGSALGTAQLTDEQGANSSSPRSLIPWNGGVAFVAEFAENRDGLAVSDGTEVGTVVEDFLAPMIGDHNEAGDIVEFDGKLFILSDGPSLFSEVDLWTWDGATAVEVASDFSTFLFNGPQQMQAAESAVLFRSGARLHRNDGTVVGAAVNGEIPGAPSLCSVPSGYQMTVLQDLVLVTGHVVDGDCELWVVDLADNSTTLVKDFDLAASSEPAFVGTFQGAAIVRVSEGVAAGELWITDGTSAGTELLGASGFDAVDSAGGSTSSEFLFSNYDTNTGRADIWKTDGTVGGTSLVKDLSGEEELVFLHAVDTGAYFWGLSGVWYSDGTSLGTILVVPGVQELQAWVTRGEDLIFAATQVAGEGRELFIVRGSTQTVERLPQVEAGPAGTSIESVLVLDDTLYLGAFRKDVGAELFTIDLSAYPSGLFSDGFESGDTTAW